MARPDLMLASVTSCLSTHFERRAQAFWNGSPAEEYQEYHEQSGSATHKFWQSSSSDTSNSRCTRYSASTLQATSEEQVQDFGPETQSAQLEVSSPISEKSLHVFSSNWSDPKCQEKATQSSDSTQSS